MTFLSNVRNRVQSAVQTARRYAPEPRRVVSGVKTVRTAYNSARSAFESARTVGQRGARAASSAVRDARQMRVYNGGRPPSAFQRVTGPLGAVNSAVSFGRGVGTTVSSVRQAVRSGSREDINTAARDGLNTTRAGLSTVQSSFQAWGANQAHRTYRGAVDAFRAATPQAARGVAESAARQATLSSFQRATGATTTATSRQVVRAAAREAALTTAQTGGRTVAAAVTGSGSRAAARAAITRGSNAAVHAATATGARAAASTVGRAAARFAPGVNVAMAAVDSANAVRTLADPNASTGSRVTSVITAAGSIAAATNIPVVSQIGAGVSAVSGFVGSFF